MMPAAMASDMSTVAPTDPMSPLPPVRAAPASPPFSPSPPPRPATSGGSASSTMSIRSWVGTDYWKATKDYFVLEERSKLHTPVSPFRDWSSQPGAQPAWDSHTNIMEHHIIDVNQYARSATTPGFGATGARTEYLRPQSPRILPGSSSTPRRTIPSMSLRLRLSRGCTRARRAVSLAQHPAIHTPVCTHYIVALLTATWYVYLQSHQGSSTARQHRVAHRLATCRLRDHSTNLMVTAQRAQLLYQPLRIPC